MKYRECRMKGCKSPCYCRGFCSPHYTQDLQRRKTVKPCSAKDCTRDAVAQGFCEGHYHIWRYRQKKAHCPETPAPPQPRTCEVEGCDRERDTDGLCRMHYRQANKELRESRPEPIYVAPSSRRHHAAVLTEVKVREVWKLLEQEWSYAEIGRHFMVDPNTISAIADGKTWRHVTEDLD